MRQPILGLKRLSHCLIVSPGSRQRSGFFPRPTGDCLIVSLSHRGPGRDPEFFPAQLGIEAIVSLSHCLTGVPAEIRSFFPPNWGLSHCLIVSPGSRQRSGVFLRPTGDCLIVSLSHRGSRQRSGFFSRPTGDCLIVSLSHCLSWGSSAAFRIASHPEHRIQSIASHRIQSIGDMASHRIASIASHRIQSIGEIASHRIASHRIASHRIQSIGGDTPCTAQGTCRAA